MLADQTINIDNEVSGTEETTEDTTDVSANKFEEML